MLKIGHVCSGEKLSVKLHEQFLFLSEKKMKLRLLCFSSSLACAEDSAFKALLVTSNWFLFMCLSFSPGQWSVKRLPPHALTASQTKLYFNSRKDEMLPLTRVAVYPASRRHLWKKNSPLRGFRTTDNPWKTQRWVCVGLTSHASERRSERDISLAADWTTIPGCVSQRWGLF